jgi:hypothetical protein
MAYQRSVGELAAIYVIFTLCLCFVAWIGTALYKWNNAPPQPRQLNAFETSVAACEKRGGIPYIKWQDRDGYSPVEVLERCDEKPVTQQ